MFLLMVDHCEGQTNTLPSTSEVGNGGGQSPLSIPIYVGSLLGFLMLTHIINTLLGFLMYLITLMNCLKHERKIQWNK